MQPCCIIGARNWVPVVQGSLSPGHLTQLRKRRIILHIWLEVLNIKRCHVEALIDWYILIGISALFERKKCLD